MFGWELLHRGSTNDLERRLEQHQNGEGANHTKKRLPVKLVYFEEFQRIDEAFYREKQVQGWSRKKKEALIRSGGFGSAQPPEGSAQPPENGSAFTQSEAEVQPKDNSDTERSRSDRSQLSEELHKLSEYKNESHYKNYENKQ